jgi:hypothetical protein
MNFVISIHIDILLVMRIKHSGDLIEANAVRSKVVQQNYSINDILTLVLLSWKFGS